MFGKARDDAKSFGFQIELGGPGRRELSLYIEEECKK